MIPTPVMEFEREHLLAKLDDMSNQERFELLDDELQLRIKEEFLASLDKEDVSNAVFAAAGLIESKAAGILGNYLKQRWGNFLSRELDGYRARIEAAWIGGRR